MYIHTQQKPFRCDYPGCNRTFRQAGKLSMHKKSHQQQIFEVKRFPRDEHPYATSKVSIATRASPGSFKVSLKLPKSASCCKHTKSDTSQDYAHKSDKLSNGELENHEMTTEGDQVLVGDVSSANGEPGTIAYEVLCRRHYRAELTARKAGVEHISRQPLPFEE